LTKVTDVTNTTSHKQSNKTAQANLLALFVSDLHLQPSMPRTTETFFAFLQEQAKSSRQLYLLGDLFEYWVGDDSLSEAFYQKIAAQIRAVSDVGTQVFWVAGNRDFLVGDGFAEAARLTLLSDPHTLKVSEQTIVLAHGDAQCTDDVAYMAFRNQVRNPQWQAQFLAMPLAQRKAIVEGLRKDSKSAQQEKTMAIMDVNPSAIEQLFQCTNASIMIHGHTHRPARHVHEHGARYVLPDWECDTEAKRGGWLALHEDASITTHGLEELTNPTND
jgi:UDP-2,3-diacylglucosamine hydrolase